ncbi:hypothetical protein E0485_20155 [Paenibacillus albiflavus]|uniref:Uncharacterized protein n=1 Tax=Paenibacillus albiflavus TaxID=2545760 RepID=A0A4R4E3Z7_9BACL|nr:hypothetical protein [Paenibacillus albiflavus]TCZ74294.1 hypothetical protein E0485_20155 [Paenibacillus albiflavus]
MDNRQDPPSKSRELIYQVGRKKGKIVLGAEAPKPIVEPPKQRLQHTVSRALFHQVKAPDAKAIIILQMLLPVIIFALTITLLIFLVQI